MGRALNATSHFLWGDGAARRNAYSLKYTGVGFAANYGASVFWALLYEALGSSRRTRSRALRDAAATAAIAYVVDYHVGLGPLGWLADKLYVARKVRKLFEYRYAAMRRLLEA